MGLKDFWDKSDSADNFLRTGKINGLVRNLDSPNIRDLGGGFAQNGSAPLSSNGCTSSSQCPSGYACVNGECTLMGGGSGSANTGGQQSTPGSTAACDPDQPNAPCNKGGRDSCQQTPNCGDTPEARECCGTRCCSFGSAASSRPGVHCFCGPCPPWPTCTDFCESYLKANGEPGPSCTEGKDGNSCGPCSYCTGSRCVDEVGGLAPCWCEQNEGSCNTGGCEFCNKETGDCEFEASRCRSCAESVNHLCPCSNAQGKQVILGRIRVCTPYGTNPTATTLRMSAEAQACQEACSSPGADNDPCTPKTETTTRCGGEGGPSCQDGETQVGVVENTLTGEACIICETSKDLPEECEECDCNCSDDCPDCSICSENGTCEPDPACQVSEGCGTEPGQLLPCPDLQTCCEEPGSECYKRFLINGEETDRYDCCPPSSKIYEVWRNVYEAFPGDFRSFFSRGGPLEIVEQSEICAAYCSGGGIGADSTGPCRSGYGPLTTPLVWLKNGLPRTFVDQNLDICNPGYPQRVASGTLQRYHDGDPNHCYDAPKFVPRVVSSEFFAYRCRFCDD